MGKSSKRKKNYYFNENRTKKFKSNPVFQLESGLVGFLCTTNFNEKGCVREAYNVLNQAADELLGSEDKSSEESKDQLNTESGDDDDEKEPEDFDTMLESELNSLRNQTNKKMRRFQQVNTKCQNCIFISTQIEDPLSLSLKIMEDIFVSKEPKTKLLLRMIPVQKTCKAFLKDVEKSAKELIENNFPPEATTYCVIFKSRNNSSITKDSTVITMNNIIEKMEVKHCINTVNPKLVINVEIIKGFCCLSILPDYLGRFCKYNLFEISKKNSVKQSSNNETVNISENIAQTSHLNTEENS